MLDWNWTLFWDDTLRLVVAALFGGALGLERQLSGHWAGLRTHMMVAIGAALFVMAGGALGGDTAASQSRVLQGITAGIGFLGAGTILKLDHPQKIKGLTTASSIWLAAALGTAAGLAQYALAAAAACVSLIVLGVLGPLERFIERRTALKTGPLRDEREKPDDRPNLHLTSPD